MNIQRPRFNFNNLLMASALAPVAIALVGTAPLSAQIIINESRTGVVRRTPDNNPYLYNNPYNNSTVYGSPIPYPSVTYPQNSYSYPSYYPGSVTRDYYPGSVTRTSDYYPGSVTRTRDYRSRGLNNPVLLNPVIQDSTLINPTIIQIHPQRRYRGADDYRTILVPRNY